jgi:hypothetical protein
MPDYELRLRINLIGVRDRALIGAVAYSFARRLHGSQEGTGSMGVWGILAWSKKLLEKPILTRTLDGRIPA